ncbi:hypothetical protein [Floridanema aerugineum]|uniref:Uncharacterized protein n=1 Tax=Floridaenema aerugineum BLCC-F46 TaxID=3153654 RepID=A0ABV4XGQ7_9CYAN
MDSNHLISPSVVNITIAVIYRMKQQYLWQAISVSQYYWFSHPNNSF